MKVLKRPDRKAQILKSATGLARTRGLRNLFKRHIANDLGINAGLINYTFGTMGALRTAVVQHAIESGDMIVVGRALVEKHNATQRLSEAVRKQALAALAA